MRPLGALITLLLFFAARGSAQEAPDAATVAGWAQTFLASVTTLDARFQQDAWVRVQARTMTSYGRLRVARPQHVRIDYDGDAGAIAVASGADYLWYQPGDGTFPGQYARGTNDAVTMAFAVLVGSTSLDRDFSVATCASVSATAPAGTSCIELRLRAAHAAFERMRMSVLTGDGARGRPARIAIELHDGTWNTFTFRELSENPSIDDASFAFEPPAGTREMPGTR